MTTHAGGDLPTVLDHLGFSVSDHELSRAFYDAALAPLGIRRVIDVDLGDGHHACGYGHDGQPRFWFSTSGVSRGHAHVAFSARDRDAVRAFHRAALAAGGRDHGAPGLRPEYHADYFAAFVYDPDGYNIEAVSHVHEAEGAGERAAGQAAVSGGFSSVR